MKFFRYKFPVLYINQFYPRPGTPAAKLKRVPTQEVKQRTKQLTELFHSYEPYRKRMGQKYQVLVTEVAHDKEHYVGHNQFYEQVRTWESLPIHQQQGQENFLHHF